MIIRIKPEYDEKLKKLLIDNRIQYEDVTHSIYDEHIIDDIDCVMEYEEHDYEELSQAQLSDMQRYVIVRLMDFDYPYYQDFISECINEWFKEMED